LSLRFILDGNESCSGLQIVIVIGEDIVDFAIKICVDYLLSPIHLLCEKLICDLDDLIADFLETSEDSLNKLSSDQSQMLKNLFEALVSWFP